MRTDVPIHEGARTFDAGKEERRKEVCGLKKASTVITASLKAALHLFALRVSGRYLFHSFKMSLSLERPSFEALRP